MPRHTHTEASLIFLPLYGPESVFRIPPIRLTSLARERCFQLESFVIMMKFEEFSLFLSFILGLRSEETCSCIYSLKFNLSNSSAAAFFLSFIPVAIDSTATNLPFFF
jgi:hypothetical protein